jgi:hypothetical protein
VELDALVLSPFDLKKAVRLVAVEGYFGIGGIMAHRNVVLPGKIDYLPEEG